MELWPRKIEQAAVFFRDLFELVYYEECQNLKNNAVILAEKASAILAIYSMSFWNCQKKKASVIFVCLTKKHIIGDWFEDFCEFKKFDPGETIPSFDYETKGFKFCMNWHCNSGKNICTILNVFMNGFHVRNTCA